MESGQWIDAPKTFARSSLLSHSIASTRVTFEVQDWPSLVSGLSQRLANDLEGLDQEIRIQYLQCLVQLGLTFDPQAYHLQKLTDNWISSTLKDRLLVLAYSINKDAAILQLDILRRVLVYAGGPKGTSLFQGRSPVLEAKRSEILGALITCLGLRLSSLTVSETSVIDCALLQKSDAFKDSTTSEQTIQRRHNDLLLLINLEEESLELFKAHSSTNVYVLMILGGAFRDFPENSAVKDGYEPAESVNKLGLHAYVLRRYTCIQDQPSPLLFAPFNDVSKAVERIRAKHPNSVLGFLGWSAGGYIASMLSHLADFIMLAYPITSMETDIAHMESRSNLLGPYPSDNLAASMSAAQIISPEGGPAYIFHSRKDEKVDIEHSLRLTRALVSAGRPVQLVVTSHGPHGFHRFGDLVGAEKFLLDIARQRKFVVKGEIDLLGVERSFQGAECVVAQNYHFSDILRN